MPNPPAKEDTWAFQPIGSPFPENPVHVLKENNMYVALWYKHGKPIHGRSWNNGGVVECSFPYKDVELTGAKDLGGTIQVLTYKGDHNSLGFWYNWIKYGDRFEKDAKERGIVKCGDSFPIYWPSSPAGPVLGYVDNKTEDAMFSINKKVMVRRGPELNDMLIIVRELVGGPPFCECEHCPKPPPPPPPPPAGEPPKPAGPPPPRVMFNEWMDIRVGDPFPKRNLVKALDKTLDTLAGENADQFVALWYMAGEPVMGRVWNEKGKVAACFSWFNREYRGDVGSIQLLAQLSDSVRGFDYGWIPFPEAAKFEGKEWFPVHINHHKGDISPCVLNAEGGKQILGKCDVRNELASYGYGGKEVLFKGPAVHQHIVLCRKPKPGYKFD